MTEFDMKRVKNMGANEPPFETEEEKACNLEQEFASLQEEVNLAHELLDEYGVPRVCSPETEECPECWDEELSLYGRIEAMKMAMNKRIDELTPLAALGHLSRSPDSRRDEGQHSDGQQPLTDSGEEA